MVLQARGEPLTDPAATHSATDLDARYGRTKHGRRPLVLGAIGSVALIALVWLVWVAVVQSTPSVSSRLLGFKVASPTSVTATFQVERSKNIEASCRLQAKAADFSIVGELTVTVAADSPRRQTLDATLTTQRDASAVILVGCTTADTHRPN
jgi:hypothetical protein